MRTHYDNLQVGRHANAEVISAAYRALSLKYHPDRNGGDEQSQKIMRIINQSYEVLSDPHKRAEHDAWIARIEAKSSEARQQTEPEKQAAKSSQGSAPLNGAPTQPRGHTSTGFDFYVEKAEPYGWPLVILALGGLWAAFGFPVPGG